MKKRIQVLHFLLLGTVLLGCATSSFREPQKTAELDLQLVRKDSPPVPPELPELHENPTLNDYLTYAALNNPGLESAFLRWKAALARIPQVRSLPDPRFTYGFYIRQVETRVGPQQQRFALNQTFPWYEKLVLQGKAAGEAAEAEKERYEAAKLKLYYQVKDAYYEYYYLSRVIMVTRENMELVGHLEEVSRVRYSAGIVAHSDVVRSQVELGKLEDRLLTLEDLRVPVVARLNASLNRPADAPLPWPKNLVQAQVHFNEDQVLTWFKESNPELKAVAHQAAQEGIKANLARKNYFPDLTLGFETIDTGEAILPGVPESGKDPVVFSVSLNVPIWWQKYRAEEREARARQKAFSKERSERENRIAADMKMVLYKYRDAERKIGLYRDSLVPKAVQTLEVTLQSYAAGLGSFSDLIDAQRILLEFQLGYERAFADRLQRLAEMEMLAGREFTKTNAPRETKPANKPAEVKERSK